MMHFKQSIADQIYYEILKWCLISPNTAKLSKLIMKSKRTNNFKARWDKHELNLLWNTKTKHYQLKWGTKKSRNQNKGKKNHNNQTNSLYCINRNFFKLDKLLPCQNQHGFIRSFDKCHTYQKSYLPQMAPKYVQRETWCQGDGIPWGQPDLVECRCEMCGPYLLVAEREAWPIVGWQQWKFSCEMESRGV